MSLSNIEEVVFNINNILTAELQSYCKFSAITDAIKSKEEDFSLLIDKLHAYSKDILRNIEILVEQLIHLKEIPTVDVNDFSEKVDAAWQEYEDSDVLQVLDMLIIGEEFVLNLYKHLSDVIGVETTWLYNKIKSIIESKIECISALKKGNRLTNNVDSSPLLFELGLEPELSMED